MKKIDIHNVECLTWCPRHQFKSNLPLEDCKKCGFFGGVEDNQVKCYRAGLPTLGNIHVTEFTKGGTTYTARHYDKSIDGEIEGNDPYDYCQKCAMCQEMADGKMYCILRNSTESEDITPFICYEGEIWKITKQEED